MKQQFTTRCELHHNQQWFWQGEKFQYSNRLNLQNIDHLVQTCLVFWYWCSVYSFSFSLVFPLVNMTCLIFRYLLPSTVLLRSVIKGSTEDREQMFIATIHLHKCQRCVREDINFILKTTLPSFTMQGNTSHY